jgi:hypothetical protein
MAPRQGTCQESSSVRLIRLARYQEPIRFGTAVIGRTPSPFVIIRFTEKKSTLECPCVRKRNTTLVRDGIRFRSRLDGLLRGDNAAVNAKREKAVPAGRAAIRRRSKQAKHPGEHAHAVFARNARHIQIAAKRAMDVPHISDRSSPGVKACVTGPAAPRAQSCQSNHVVLYAASPRATGTVAMTHRT